MKFKLEIDCNTVAFGDKPELHLADILRGIANTVQYIGSDAISDRPAVVTPVTDVNGIHCGTWEMSKRK